MVYLYKLLCAKEEKRGDRWWWLRIASSKYSVVEAFIGFITVPRGFRDLEELDECTRHIQTLDVKAALLLTTHELIYIYTATVA